MIFHCLFSWQFCFSTWNIWTSNEIKSVVLKINWNFGSASVKNHCIFHEKFMKIQWNEMRSFMIQTEVIDAPRESLTVGFSFLRPRRGAAGPALVLTAPERRDGSAQPQSKAISMPALLGHLVVRCLQNGCRQRHASEQWGGWASPHAVASILMQTRSQGWHCCGWERPHNHRVWSISVAVCTPISTPSTPKRYAQIL